MPAVFRKHGIRFFFFSNEGSPREPMHIHAESGDGEAKIWRHPDIVIASSAGYNRKQLTRPLKIAEDNHEQIERAWNEHFS